MDFQADFINNNTLLCLKSWKNAYADHLLFKFNCLTIINGQTLEIFIICLETCETGRRQPLRVGASRERRPGRSLRGLRLPRN